jgi:hypothetical protein
MIEARFGVAFQSSELVVIRISRWGLFLTEGVEGRRGDGPAFTSHEPTYYVGDQIGSARMRIVVELGAAD